MMKGIKKERKGSTLVREKILSKNSRSRPSKTCRKISNNTNTKLVASFFSRQMAVRTRDLETSFDLIISHQYGISDSEPELRSKLTPLHSSTSDINTPSLEQECKSTSRKSFDRSENCNLHAHPHRCHNL